MSVYPLEKYEFCTTFKGLKVQGESRFNKQLTSQSEYDVQNGSGVLRSLLEDTARFSTYVPDIRVKKDINLFAYTRAAPALECDSDETLQLMLDTSKVYDADKIDESSVLLTAAFGLTIATLAVFAISFIFLVVTMQEFEGGKKAYNVHRPMIFIILAVIGSLGTLIASLMARSAYAEDKVSIDNLYGNYACGDSISSQIGETMNGEVAGRSETGIEGATYLLIVGILTCLLSMLTLALAWLLNKAISY